MEHIAHEYAYQTNSSQTDMHYDESYSEGTQRAPVPVSAPHARPQTHTYTSVQRRRQTPAQEYYACIDLKSFYASVECVDRGLDTLTTDLVVADPERSATTICLAVSPSLKKKGVKNRCRVFEIPSGMDYIMAPPRMRRYMEVSAHIVGIYLRFVAPEDIYVYSIDECFVRIDPYMNLYHADARAVAAMMRQAVLDEVGIHATVGIGENLFQAKVALDLYAKHSPGEIAELNQWSFLERVWTHTPITDIWNIGPGIARRLAKFDAHTLRDVAGLKPEILYKEFGKNAEFLIDHAWGIEPCTLEDISSYTPSGESVSVGQVLFRDYTAKEARVIVREMTGAALDELIARGKAAGGVFISIGYSYEHPESVGASVRPHALSHILDAPTDSLSILYGNIDMLFGALVLPGIPIRRIHIGFTNLVENSEVSWELFDVDARRREITMGHAVVAIKERFGKNAVFPGVSLRDCATGRERNVQVGGHRA